MLAAGGYRVHAPLRPWLRQQLLERSDRLFAWTLASLSADDFDATVIGATPTAVARQVRDALDGFNALGIDLEPWLSPEVMAWYRASSRDCLA
jgi:hypothetical protein